MSTALTEQEVRDQLDLPDLETTEERAQRVIREPLIYRVSERRSYFKDLFMRRDDSEARERLESHGRQMADLPTESRELELDGLEYERRVNPNLEEGHGSEFAPPLWLNREFAPGKRTGPVLQKLIPTFDLPKGVSSVNLPRITGGTSVSPQQPGGPVDSKEVLTKAAKSPAVVFAGQSDWSIQALEQSPAGAHLDWAILFDLHESCDEHLENAFIKNTVEANQFQGLLDLSETNTITYTSASPTGTAMVPYIGQAIAEVGVKRKRPPEALLMNTSRFAWLCTSEDASNRPLSIEDYPLSDFPRAGFAGYGVYNDDAILQTYGSEGNQDAIIACRPKDMILLDSAPVTMVAEDVLSGTMEVRFQLHRTVAAILGRYPPGVSKLIGTGMVPLTGFK
jgi:hypothetical protein